MRDYLRRTLSGQLPLFSLGADNAVVQVRLLCVHVCVKVVVGPGQVAETVERGAVEQATRWGR